MNPEVRKLGTSFWNVFKHLSYLIESGFLRVACVCSIQTNHIQLYNKSSKHQIIITKRIINAIPYAPSGVNVDFLTFVPSASPLHEADRTNQKHTSNLFYTMDTF